MMIVSGLLARMFKLTRRETIKKPAIIPMITPPSATKIKCSTPVIAEKVPFCKTDKAKSRITSPVASLNKDSSSKASLTFSGMAVPLVIDLTATASVGVTMAARAMATGSVHLVSKLLVKIPTTKALAPAKTTDRKNTTRKRWRIRLKDCF